MISMGNKQKRRNALILILVVHTLIIPGIIMAFGDAFTKNKDYVFVSIGVALLWITIFGKMYVKKITKLQQEIDAEQQR